MFSVAPSEATNCGLVVMIFAWDGKQQIEHELGEGWFRSELNKRFSVHSYQRMRKRIKGFYIFDKKIFARVTFS